jgi:phosphate transport system substrate-binding protein
MPTRLIAVVGAVCAAAVLLAACGGSDNRTPPAKGLPAGLPKGGQVTSAGVTFAQPLYADWAARYRRATGTAVAVGPGMGLAAFTSGHVDFAATDTMLTSRELALAHRHGRTVHIPTVAGAVVVGYNLPGVGSGVRLDGPTLANIFLGNIRRWDDQRIRAQNRNRRLPPTPIAVCHRNDLSQTTQLFTTYLSDTSRQFNRKVGPDRLATWPVGTGATGNAGVASCVKGDEGSIGYVEQAYGLRSGLALADLRNRAGNYVKPSLESTTSALQGVPVPYDLRFTTVDTPARFGYPVADVTYIVVHQDLCKAGIAPDVAQRVKGYLDYAVGGGQLVAPQLGFAPLTPKIDAAAKEKVASLLCNGKPLG